MGAGCLQLVKHGLLVVERCFGRVTGFGVLELRRVDGVAMSVLEIGQASGVRLLCKGLPFGLRRLESLPFCQRVVGQPEHRDFVAGAAGAARKSRDALEGLAGLLRRR